MTCFKCKGDMVASTTTDVTDTGNYLIIIRNVPCYKCTKCDKMGLCGLWKWAFKNDLLAD